MKTPDVNIQYLHLKLRFMVLIAMFMAGITALQAQQQYPVKINVANGKVTATYKDLFFNAQKGLRSLKPETNGHAVVNTVITLSITTRASTCEDPNGAALVTASGGTAPYQYTLDGTYWFNTGNFPQLRGGNFTVTVVDATGQTVSQPFTVGNTNNPPVASIASFVNTTSCNTADGSLVIGVTGGTPPYQYSMDNLTYQASNAFNNLYGGDYYCFVKDANGCIGRCGTGSIGDLMYPFCQIRLGIAPALIRCGRPSYLTIGCTGPDGPYSYSLDGINYQASGMLLVTAPGNTKTYTKDVHGNILIFNVFTPYICTINIDFIAVAASCGQADGTLTATASDGTPPYTYSLDGINFQSSPVFTGLWPGNYYVTAKDAANNTYSMTGTVYDRCPKVTLTETDETCALNNGTITATGANGTAPYQYAKDGVSFQSSNIFTGLTAAPYTITIKDALGFTSTANITVKYKCLRATTAVTNVVCSNHNGTITVTATDGMTPYQYSLDGVNFQSSNVFTLLGAGSYTVTVKDNTGLTATAGAVITDAPAPTMTVTATRPSCSNNDGVITINAAGGTAPLSYSINNINFQPSNVFTNLAAQNYTAVIKDANGCTVSATGNISVECPTILASAVNETCGTGNGQITVTATNAIAPYQYSLDGVTYQNSNIFNGLISGLYTITVKDANGYINTTTATIANNCPSVTATVKDDACNSGTGSITATGVSGTLPYTFSIDGVNFTAGNIFTGLTAATYTVTIKDAQGTKNTTQVTVGNIAGPQASYSTLPATCLNNDGKITLFATGGTAPFQYSIDAINYQASNIFNAVAAGGYTGWVKDANGCKNPVSITVATDTTLTISTGSTITICEGGSQKIAAASNGTGFLWSPATGLDNAGKLNPVASPVVTTDYLLTATLGVCKKTAYLQVIVNPAPIAAAGPPATICFGQSTQLNGAGGIYYNWAPTTYLTDATAYNTMVNSPGNDIVYSLKVKDANGCQSLNDATVKITVTPAAKVFAGNDTSVIANQPFQLNAVDVNNSGFKKYEWTPAINLTNALIQNPVLTPPYAATYKVTATTAAGCQGSDAINITVYKGPEIYVPNAFTPNGDGINDLLSVVPVGIKQFKYFVIYNRYGQKIFYTEDPTKKWDGKFGGQNQPYSVFIWMAEGVDDKGKSILRKGEVTLIR